MDTEQIIAYVAMAMLAGVVLSIIKRVIGMAARWVIIVALSSPLLISKLAGSTQGYESLITEIRNLINGLGL